MSLFLLMIKQTIEFPMTSTVTSMTRTVVIPADSGMTERFSVGYVTCIRNKARENRGQ